MLYSPNPPGIVRISGFNVYENIEKMKAFKFIKIFQYIFYRHLILEIK